MLNELKPPRPYSPFKRVTGDLRKNICQLHYSTLLFLSLFGVTTHTFILQGRHLENAYFHAVQGTRAYIHTTRMTSKTNITQTSHLQ